MLTQLNRVVSSISGMPQSISSEVCVCPVWPIWKPKCATWRKIAVTRAIFLRLTRPYRLQTRLHLSNSSYSDSGLKGNVDIQWLESRHYRLVFLVWLLICWRFGCGNGGVQTGSVVFARPEWYLKVRSISNSAREIDTDPGPRRLRISNRPECIWKWEKRKATGIHSR